MTSCNGPISVPSDADPMEQHRSGLNWDRFTRGGFSSTIAVEGGDGMAKRVAELMVEVLSGAGVKRVYGVSGDSLNGFTDAASVSLSRTYGGNSSGYGDFVLSSGVRELRSRSECAWFAQPAVALSRGAKI